MNCTKQKAPRLVHAGLLDQILSAYRMSVMSACGVGKQLILTQQPNQADKKRELNIMNQIITHNGNSWQAYFNLEQAYQAVFAHVASLPSSRKVGNDEPDYHTARAYKAGLDYYLSMFADHLPTPHVIQSYIAHLTQRGLKASTINSKYLAPLRHWLKALASQIDPYAPKEIYALAYQITLATQIKSVKSETTSHVSALWRVGKRLEMPQIRATLNFIDRTTITGLRDYALLITAFSTGLRLAELSRITQNSITPSGDGVWIITVRGKRNNIDPVPISAQVKNAIDAYITAYNLLAPSPLAPNASLWQSIRKGNHPTPQTKRGISHQCLSDILGKWTEIAGERLAPHDFRRTAASIAYSSGMELKNIQQLLRHADLSTTDRYIKDKPTFANRVLALPL